MLLRRFLLVAFLLAIGSVFAIRWALDGDADYLSDAVYAVVDGTPISAHRFKTSYVDYLIVSGKNDTARNRWLHLDNLIDTYLLGKRASAIELDSIEAFQHAWALFRKQALGGRFYETQFLDTLVYPDDAAVRRAYAKQQEKVVIRHLLYGSEEAALADYALLQAGEDFVDLANQVYRTEEYDSLAGFLGVSGYWELDDAFAEAAYSLPLNQPSKPVRTRYGWHIIRVEDKVVNPLLTESAYQYRREGVEGKVWVRKVRLQGDVFIRDFMAQRDVRVDRDMLIALQSAVRERLDAAGYTANRPSALSTEEVRVIRDVVQPDAVLATFELEGERVSFTAADYVFWLETLPVHEVYHRTGASLGRALRNEVLARMGAAEGLENDPIFLEETLHFKTSFLATAMRDSAATWYPVEPTIEQLGSAADRNQLLALKSTAADFWSIPFNTFEEATAARDRIARSEVKPDAFDGYSRYEAFDYRSLPALSPYIPKAPQNQEVVVGAGQAWYLLQVMDVTNEFKTTEEVEKTIYKPLKRQLSQVEMIKSLRGTHLVQLDTLLFERHLKDDGL